MPVVELDERLIGHLEANAPDTATIIQGDGVSMLTDLAFDVLLSNLPTEVTETRLRDMLPDLQFRTAVLAVG